jgi:HAD superfamily hydrolase (TIGR01509 family)
MTVEGPSMMGPRIARGAHRPTILFDVMGTLVRDPFFDDMPAFFGLDLAGLLAAKHPTAWIEFERGEIDEAACMEKFFHDRRVFDVEAFKSCVAAGYAFLPGIEELLSELVGRGVEIHAFSNYSPWWSMIESRLGLSRYLRWTFLSCETGLRKPDPEAYRSACRTLGRPASSLLFVDDREANVRAAHAVGMPALLFHDAARLRDDLRALGVL